MGKHGMMITNDSLLHILLLSFFNMYILLLTMNHKCCFFSSIRQQHILQMAYPMIHNHHTYLVFTILTTMLFEF
jgi:hypothetical protein